MSPRPVDRLSIALAQLNPIVGDVAGNADKVRQARVQAANAGADLVAFPELFLAGDPPEDLVLKPAFQAACRPGGQDELVFDGSSFALNADRTIAAQLPAFSEALAVTQWERIGSGWRCATTPSGPVEEGEKADYAACVLGLRDYVNKSGFSGVVIG